MKVSIILLALILCMISVANGQDPNITIISPTPGGETWKSGTEHNITWEPLEGPNTGVMILIRPETRYISYDSDQIAYVSTGRSYRWKVSDDLRPGRYFLEFKLWNPSIGNYEWSYIATNCPILVEEKKFSILPSGNKAILVGGTINSRYELSFSSNLVDWSPAMTIVNKGTNFFNMPLGKNGFIMTRSLDMPLSGNFTVTGELVAGKPLTFTVFSSGGENTNHVYRWLYFQELHGEILGHNKTFTYAFPSPGTYDVQVLITTGDYYLELQRTLEISP